MRVYLVGFFSWGRCLSRVADCHALPVTLLAHLVTARSVPAYADALWTLRSLETVSLGQVFDECGAEIDGLLATIIPAELLEEGQAFNNGESRLGARVHVCVCCCLCARVSVCECVGVCLLCVISLCL